MILNCRECWPPQTLIYSKWLDPEFRCKNCGRWYDRQGRARPPPDLDEEPIVKMGLLREFLIRERVEEI